MKRFSVKKMGQSFNKVEVKNNEVGDVVFTNIVRRQDGVHIVTEVCLSEPAALEIAAAITEACAEEGGAE